MANDSEQQSGQLNLTVVALVALVAIVGLVALVLNAASISSVAQTRLSTGGTLAIAQPIDADAEQNVVGDLKRTTTGPIIR